MDIYGFNISVEATDLFFTPEEAKKALQQILSMWEDNYDNLQVTSTEITTKKYEPETFTGLVKSEYATTPKEASLDLRGFRAIAKRYEDVNVEITVKVLDTTCRTEKGEQEW